MNRNKKYGSIILLGITILMSICIYEVHISYNNLTLNHYTINNEKINKDINLVIISDLHDNKLGEDNKVLIDKINQQSPEIILVVGDMVNKDSQNSDTVINLMKELTKDTRVFYSLGNSEKDYISGGTSNLKKQLEDVGVTVLDNEYKDVKLHDTTVRIGGMYDYAFGLKEENKSHKDDTDRVINNKDEEINEINRRTYNFLCDFEDTDNYKIIMAHRPDSFIFGDASNIWDVDLVVSGHTHGGQVVVPFLGGLYVGDQGWFPQYTKGLYNLNKIKMIITSGLGSNKEKLPRFNNVPEVVNLEISKE